MEESPGPSEQDSKHADFPTSPEPSAEDGGPEEAGTSERSIFRKRKHRSGSRLHGQHTTQHAKRARTDLTEGYLHEFNQTILETITGLHDESWSSLEPSQIGISYWSSGEKERLFLSLGRIGREKPSEAAKFIPSKSELEVQEYLNLLERGTIEHELTERRADLLTRSVDIPAAAEISQELCNALEQAADTASNLVYQNDCLEEQARFPNRWLMMEQVSDSNTQPLKDYSHADSLDDSNKISQAFDLLDAQQMLELSSRIFMNSPDPLQSWQHLADSGETPSMFATTLVDLYSLVIAATRRLVSTTLFHAMTRLRSSDNMAIYKKSDSTDTKGSRPAVRPSDVHTAAQSLSIPQDSVGFWRDAPRRLGLHVHDTDQMSSYRYPSGKHRYTFGLAKAPLLDLDTVERLLSASCNIDADNEPEIGPSLAEHSVETGHDRAQSGLDQRGDLHTGEHVSHGGEQETTSSSSSAHDTSESDEGFEEFGVDASDEQAETTYLEQLDAHASRLEEQRLVALLPPETQSELLSNLHSNQILSPVPVDVDDSPGCEQHYQPSPKTRKPRKTLQDLEMQSWRTSAVKNFVPEWERYGRALPAEAFEEIDGKASSVVSGERQLRKRLSRLTRADLKGKIRSWSRSVSRGRSSRSLTPFQASLHADTENESGSNTDTASISSSRRSTRSASRPRVDYSNSGFGASADLFRCSPLDDGEPSESLQGSAHDDFNNKEQNRKPNEFVGEDPQAEDTAVPSTEIDEAASNVTTSRAPRTRRVHDGPTRARMVPKGRAEHPGKVRVVSAANERKGKLSASHHESSRKSTSQVEDSGEDVTHETPTKTNQKSTSPIRLGRAPRQSLWSSEDDAQLRSAHSQGLTWAEIVRRFFPGKTANACQQRFVRIERQRRRELDGE